MHLPHKRQVHDRTDEEEFRLVYAQLPTGMQNMVSQEIVRRGLNSLWVKVNIPDGETALSTMFALENELRESFKRAIEIRQGILVECCDQPQRERLLALDGRVLGRGVVTTWKYRRDMTGEEIFAYVTQFLQGEAHADNLRRAYGHVYPGMTQVGGVDPGSPGSQSPRSSPQRSHRDPAWDSDRWMPRCTTMYRSTHARDLEGRDGKGGGQGTGEQGGPSNEAPSDQDMVAHKWCFTCRHGRRDCKHDYWTCPYGREWRSRKERMRGKGGTKGGGSGKPTAKDLCTARKSPTAERPSPSAQ